VRPRRHRFRRVKRLLGVVTALAVLGGITFAGLMLVLPGVGDAPAVAEALDRATTPPISGRRYRPRWRPR